MNGQAELRPGKHSRVSTNRPAPGPCWDGLPAVRAELVSDDENNEAQHDPACHREDRLMRALARRVSATIRRDRSDDRGRATVLRAMRCWEDPSHYVTRCSSDNRADE